MNDRQAKQAASWRLLNNISDNNNSNYYIIVVVVVVVDLIERGDDQRWQGLKENKKEREPQTTTSLSLISESCEE